MAVIYCSRDRGFQQDNCYGVKNEDIVDFLNYTYFKSNKPLDMYNETRKKSLLSLIKAVMDNELTEKQRQAVLLVKAQRLKQKQAAKIMKISNSTICRHLKAAQKKFDVAFRYFEYNKTQIYE